MDDRIDDARMDDDFFFWCTLCITAVAVFEASGRSTLPLPLLLFAFASQFLFGGCLLFLLSLACEQELLPSVGRLLSHLL